MKEAVLGTLATPSNVVRGQVASLVAGIAAIEIPRGEWTELISNLCNNSANEDVNVRLASL